MKKFLLILLVSTFCASKAQMTGKTLELEKALGMALQRGYKVIDDYSTKVGTESIINSANFLKNYKNWYDTAQQRPSIYSLTFPPLLTTVDQEFITTINNLSRPLWRTMAEKNELTQSLPQAGVSFSFLHPQGYTFYDRIIEHLYLKNPSIMPLLNTLPAVKTFLQQASVRDKQAFYTFLNDRANIGTTSNPFNLLYETTLIETPLTAVYKTILTALQNARPAPADRERKNPLVIKKNGGWELTPAGHEYFEYLKKYVNGL